MSHVVTELVSAGFALLLHVFFLLLSAGFAL